MEQRVVGTYRNGIGLHILAAYINRCAHSKPQSLALSEGVSHGTAVRSHNVSACVKEIPLGIRFPGIRFKESLVIAVWDKADILTVMLFRVDEPQLLGNFPDVFLGVAAEREQRVCQLILGQAVKEITLILCRIRCLLQKVTSIFFGANHLRVMPSNDIVAVQLKRTRKELVKFQITVAIDAGIGGETGFVAVYEAIDHHTAKFPLKIKNMIGNAQPLSNRPCIVDILCGAAAGFGGAQPHGCTNAGKALLQNQVRGDRTVDSAA